MDCSRLAHPAPTSPQVTALGHSAGAPGPGFTNHDALHPRDNSPRPANRLVRGRFLQWRVMDSNQRRTTPTVLQGGHEIALTSGNAHLQPISARNPHEQLDLRDEGSAGARAPGPAPTLAGTPAVGILLSRPMRVVWSDAVVLGRRLPNTENVTMRPERPVTPRADLVERALPFLPEGSKVRQAFIGQAAPNFFYFIVTYLTGLMFRNKYRCVAVTSEAIYVLDSTKRSGGAKPRALVGKMPRNTRLGPVSGRWAEVDLLGERHWVHTRFHDQVTAANREAGF